MVSFTALEVPMYTALSIVGWGTRSIVVYQDGSKEQVQYTPYPRS